MNPNHIPEEKATIEAVKKGMKTVVSIVISKDLPKIKEFFYPFGPFFGPFGFFFPEGEEKEHIKVGGGSGFIVSEDGLILTNKHVVFDPESDYTIITNDEKEYKAKVLARDPINDIAILKIEAKNLSTLPLGDSDDLEIGQTVIAIGFALGIFQNTVSKGVVSGLSRKIEASMGFGAREELRGVIQTDVAINQGNSGGPLLNLKGEAIGINTAIVLGAQNVGFAIPINKVTRDLEDIKKYGRIIKPSLGIRYVLLNKDLKERFSLPIDYGALIVKDPTPGSIAVLPKSPADKAGLKENDVILAIDDKKIDEKNPLIEVVENLKTGDEVELTVLREKEEFKVKIKLEERTY